MANTQAMWSTKTEIKYIEDAALRLRDASYIHLRDITYDRFLRLYLKAARRRKDWKNIDKDEVIYFITEKLKRFTI